MRYKVFEYESREWLMVNLDMLPISLENFLISECGDALLDPRGIRGENDYDYYPGYHVVATKTSKRGQLKFVKFFEQIFDTDLYYAVVIEANEYSEKIIAVNEHFDKSNPLYEFLDLCSFEVQSGSRVYNFFDQFYIIGVDHFQLFYTTAQVDTYFKKIAEVERQIRKIGYRYSIIRFEDKFMECSSPISVEVRFEANGDGFDAIDSDVFDSYAEALRHALLVIQKEAG